MPAVSSDVSVDVWCVTAMAVPSSVCAMPNGSPGIVAPRVSCGSTLLPVAPESTPAHAAGCTHEKSLKGANDWVSACGPSGGIALAIVGADVRPGERRVASNRREEARVPTTPLTPSGAAGRSRTRR